MKFTKEQIELMPPNIREQFEGLFIKKETKYKSISVTLDGIFLGQPKKEIDILN